MNTFAGSTDELELTSAGLTVGIKDNIGFGTARAAALGNARITDTLVLAGFSAIYETTVILLRLRSRLAASSSHDKYDKR